MTTIKLPTGTFEYDSSKPLGRRGGFGQVYAGRTSKGDEVAVKKLHVTAAEARHRELRIAEELRGHKFNHVMEFIDSGQDADSGSYFVVMPKAERSLQADIDCRAGINITEMASILRQVACGLMEVDNLVHRDLKPDNILFHEGKWKVADFGIARFTEEATSTNTLKECLSRMYAAPEQFRFERATHATDVYALGCIAFCLLTGQPPFTQDPAKEHQQSPLPVFLCSDPQFRNAINQMLRKPPESRPILSRVVNIFDEIISSPHAAQDDGSWGLLTNAAAQIATTEQQEEARIAKQRMAEEARNQHANEAYQSFADNLERLWGKIHAKALNVKRVGRERDRYFECSLGNGNLLVTMTPGLALPPNLFKHSGWDVIASGAIRLTQNTPRCEWASSLWYAKIKGSTEHRWQEVSYYCFGASPPGPYVAGSPQDADRAAARIADNMTIAFGPEIIDGEKEKEFHDRWGWLFGKAVSGQLIVPPLPIHRWPPPGM